MSNKYLGLAFVLVGLGVASFAHAATDWSTQDYDLYPGDFNGDGRSDLLYIAKSLDKLSGIAISDPNTGGPNTIHQSWPSNYLHIDWNQYIAVVGDYNADGKSDVLLQRATAGDHYLLFANSQGQLTQVSHAIPNACHGVSWSADQHKIFAGRFSGESFEGKPKWDLFLQSTTASGVSGLIKTRLRVSADDPFAGQIDGCDALQLDYPLADNALNFSLSASLANLFVGDFDGDDLDDLLVQGKPKFVMIDYEVAFPVPTYKNNMNGIAYSQGGSNPFQLSAIYAWNRIDASGRDWSPLSYNLAVGDYNGDNISDVIFQARSSGQTSKWLASPGGTQGFGTNSLSSLSGSVTWSADSNKLIVGNFDGGNAVGVYLQAVSSSGTNAYVNDVTNGSAAPTSQGTVQNSNAQVVTSAGRTVGKFDVSPTGAATYAIPVWVPPGPRGIQPNLAITYNSQGGDGVMGPGWGIAGLSAITRCNKTHAQDGNPSAVTLTASDAYCLNGNRLRLVSGDYAADGSVYHTEIADFSKVILHTLTGVEGGPAWFEVWGKDGLIYYYGNSVDSDNYYGSSANNGSRVMASGTSVATQWLLNKVMDRSGNKYVVAYAEDANGDPNSAGIGVPTLIAYTPTSSGATSYRYTVEFSYGPESTEGTEAGYVNATLVKNANRLTSINVKHTGNIVRKYSFGYQLSSTTARARVSTIQECAGSNGMDCLAPTQIAYQDGEKGVTEITAPSQVGAAPADFNGDGKTDVAFFDANNLWHVQLSTGTGFGSPIPTGAQSIATINRFSGKQADEFLSPHADGTLYLHTYNNGTFTEASAGFHLGGIYGVYNFPSSADINGDGYSDIVWADQFSTKALFYRLNQGGDGTSYGDAQWGAHTFGAQPNTYSNGEYFDFNADGKEDLLIDVWRNNEQEEPDTQIYLHGIEWYGGSSFLVYPLPVGHIAYADFNEDGCTDLVNKKYIYLSSCSGQAGGGQVTFDPTLAEDAVGAFDWNGDGRSDLLVKRPQVDNTIWVRLAGAATSSGFSAPIPTNIDIGSMGSVVTGKQDFDGDGLQDLVVTYSDGQNVNQRYFVHKRAGKPADLVTAITDGYGVAHQPSYVSIAQSSYTKGSGATGDEQDIQDARYVVNQVVATDGAGGTYSQTFSYTGARRDLKGRGFAGFQSITKTDSRVSAPVVKTYFRTDFPYTGMVKQQDIFQNNGATLISRTINTPDVIVLDGTANNQRYFPYVHVTTTDTYEVGGIKNGQLVAQSSATLDYDSYGNLTNSTTVLTDKDGGSPASPTYNQSWTTTISSPVTPDTSNWCIGIPSQTSVTRSATNVAAITRVTSYTRDSAASYSKCRISEQVVEPLSNAYRVTIGYGYDAFGNVDMQTVTGINMAPRTATVNWGSTGQFPEIVRDPVAYLNGYQTRKWYDYSKGVLTSEVVQSTGGVNNSSAMSWEYDAFGRREKETRVDGTYTTYSYYNCVVWGCQNGDPLSGSTGINRMVIIARSKNISGGEVRDDWTYLDQFDRTIVTKAKNLSGGYTRIGQQYDAFGNVYRETSPCEMTGCIAYWTTNSYDPVNRVTQISRPISASNTTLQNTLVAYQGMTTITTDPQNMQSTRIVDPNGWMRRSKDHNGYYQNFTYDAFGSLKAVTDSLSNPLFSADYVYGIGAFQTSTTDMDLGGWGYTPNALGEVVSFMDARLSTSTLTYDELSRLRSKTVPGEMKRKWIWGTNASAHNIGQLVEVCVDNSGSDIACPTSGIITHKETYTYDAQARLERKDILADGTTYTYNYAYNGITGFLETLQYPASTGSPLKVKYEYSTANGALQRVRDFTNNVAGTAFWQANAINARGQVTQDVLGNGIVRNRSFDAVTGWLSSIQAGVGGSATVQNESYLFDKMGNVIQRQNNNQGLTENFYYDSLYRLDYSQLNNATNLDMTYDDMGRILSQFEQPRNTTWTYTYHGTKKHAVTQAGTSTYTYDANGNAETRNGQTIVWDKHNYPTSIHNSASENVALSYTADSQRWKQVYVNGATTEETLYLGGLLEKVTIGSTIDWRHYIYANGRAAVAVVSRLSTGTNTTRYVLEDHQDSPAKITDSSGAVYASESFTAYGARRDSTDWLGSPSGTELTNINNVSRQGYTWQTALGNMGLNHMNGRVQDAITGVFISADPFITEPHNTQNYHRYGYVYNNPLSLIDPTGFNVVPEACTDEKGCTVFGPPSPPTPHRSTNTWVGDGMFVIIGGRGAFEPIDSEGFRKPPKPFVSKLIKPEVELKEVGTETQTPNQCGFFDTAADVFLAWASNNASFSLQLNWLGSTVGKYDNYNSFSVGVTSGLQLYVSHTQVASPGSLRGYTLPSRQPLSSVGAVSLGFSVGASNNLTYTGVSTQDYLGVHAYAGAGVSYELQHDGGSVQGSMLGDTKLRNFEVGVGLGADLIRGQVKTFTSATKPGFGFGRTKYSGCAKK